MKANKRLISLFTAALIVLQSVPYMQKVSAIDSVKASGSFNIGGATVSHEQFLTDNRNGTYTLSIAMSADYQHKDNNENQHISKNGYFQAEHTGKYLIELWGGSGAAGAQTSYGAGGNGGEGGHIYGTVELNAGDILYYAVGGNGESTLSNDEGGGANGDGGNHGDTGSYTVGGGGGYSAVYKFTEEEFSKYINADGSLTELSEADRVKNYIMIAGGGGGGGAGNGFSFSSQSGQADGGAGGSIGSASGVLKGTGYDVEGTFFAGENGKSSGSSAAYIGHGGTNLPGSISDTLLTFFEGEEPNDWRATYNTTEPGGAGGSGNLRGGAGGAGFCGGSGGIMTGLLTATNVGGGGGGSSFIAESVNYSLSDTEKELLDVTHKSDTGGSVSITYLVDEDQSFLENLSFTLEASKYFRILDEAVCTGGTITEYTRERIKIEGASVMPVKDSGTPPLSIKVYLAPKIGFAGGNGVPLLNGSSFLCETESGETAAAELGEECSYVNVPLNFQIIPRNSTNNTPNTPCPVTDFYTDLYAGVRGNLSADPNYDFISEIGSYQVKNTAGETVTGSVEHPETTRYSLSFNVKPKDGKIAAVGDPVGETEYTASALYQVISKGEGTLNGNKLVYDKKLSFDEASGLYRLDLKVDSSTDDTLTPVAGVKYEYVSDESISYTVPVDGYYLLQAWGADGGDGKHWTSYNKVSDGGKGGYVSGYIHLSEGSVIRVDSIGANGKDGNRSDWFAPGYGGNFTKISVAENISSEFKPVLIAGGGGGGGRDAPFITAYPGENGQIGAEETAAPNSDESVYNGTDGGNAENETPDGKGGPAGQNFKSTLMDDEFADHPLYDTGKDVIKNASDGNYTNNGKGGAVYITCVQTDRIDHTEDQQKGELSDYTLETGLSQYFDYVKTEGTNSDGTPLENGGYTYENGLLTVNSINPAVTTDNVVTPDGKMEIVSTVSFTVSIYLKPKQGFLGGNDVPLLDTAGAAGNTGMRLSQPQMTDVDDLVSQIAQVDPADFANVVIPYFPDPSDLQTFEKTYIRGGTPVNKSELYSWNNAPSAAEDWQDDFVSILRPNDEALTPDVTTFYPITVGIEPKALPEKAGVIPSAEAVTLSGEAVIYVNAQIIYNLTNITTDDTPVDGIYSSPEHEPYIAFLTAADGYELPAAVSVTDNDGKALAHSFDRKTGMLIIPAESMAGTVHITAAGEVNTYTLSFVYEEKPGGLPKTKTFELRAGAALPDMSQVFVPTAEQTEKYEFIWDWGDGQTKPPAAMPGRDLWVTGTFVPRDFTITINYRYPDDEIFKTVTVTKPYGSEYQVTAPAVPGYLPDTPIISGTVDGDATVDVGYKATENSLNILYFYRDNPESPVLYKEYSADVATGESFSVTSEDIAGYTPDKKVIEGVMEAEGATYYVYYDPNEYTVTFDAAGGVCGQVSKVVVFNNPYNYNPEGGYSALPEPIRVGYEFEGWYLGDRLITETSKVTEPLDHTLTAKWRAITSTLTVRYRFEDGRTAADDAVRQLVFGENYSIPSPEIKGYTADKPLVSGSMPAANAVIDVTYTANLYTLTVRYTDSETGAKLFDDYVQNFKYLEEYSVTSPEKASYTYAETVNGVMGAEDREITVYYYKTEPTVSVTVEWGDLNYVYTHGDWDPETHTYEKHPIKPETADRNTVTVTNSAESTIPIDAQFGYIPAQGYESLTAYYTAGGRDDTPLPQVTVPAGGAVKSYVWLEGELSRSITQPFTAGSCLVTIKGGKE